MSDTFQLVSPLGVEECISRLQNMLDRESGDLSRLQFAKGDKPFAGEVMPEGFLLRKRVRGRNSFQTFASGNFHTHNFGTLINVQCGTHPGFRLGYVAYGCCLVFIALPIGLHLLHEIGAGELNWQNWQDSSYKTELMGLLMLCVFPLLFAFGRFMAVDESAALYDFLKRTLEARDALLFSSPPR